MAVEHTVGVYHANGNNTINTRNDLTADTEINLVFTIAASTTDQQQQIGFDAVDVVAVSIMVTGSDGIVTLQTNDATTSAHNGVSGGNGFLFPADGGEMHWSERDPRAGPFGTTDVTTTYWTNAGTTTATVTVKILLNS
jgi:hypothetical protein